MVNNCGIKGAVKRQKVKAIDFASPGHHVGHTNSSVMAHGQGHSRDWSWKKDHKKPPCPAAPGSSGAQPENSLAPNGQARWRRRIYN